MLRDYQQRTIDQLYAWFDRNATGNPCLVLPTGSGKSHIIAALCKRVLQEWPDSQILMLTHVKELIEQNVEKLRQHWPDVPVGIYSASIGKKQLGEPITFAGIQSIRKKAALLGHIDLVLVDECHLIAHKDQGGYRSLLAELLAINPRLRVVGLTATPYRLGHGMITDEPAIFRELIEPTNILELVRLGHLAPLRSKHTTAQLDTSEVHKRGGEFIEAELQAAVDTADQNNSVVREIIKLAGDRKAWLAFCSGVQHAWNICDKLNELGIVANCITGATSKKERERIIGEFKAGRIRCLTNANVLTTGFDYPDIDLIAMLRPTMSPGLYVQMAGRGLRPKSHTDHCLVLDFAAVVATHGPITHVRPPNKKGEKEGAAPVKVCDNCQELCALAARVCPACGHPFPEPEVKKLKLQNDDIMGLAGKEMEVTAWRWRKHVSRASGQAMLMVTYYGALSDAPVSEYMPVNYSGYSGEMARRTVAEIALVADVAVTDLYNPLDVVADILSCGKPPDIIEFKMDGKYHRVLQRKWKLDAPQRA